MFEITSGQRFFQESGQFEMAPFICGLHGYEEWFLDPNLSIHVCPGWLNRAKRHIR